MRPTPTVVQIGDLAICGPPRAQPDPFASAAKGWSPYNGLVWESPALQAWASTVLQRLGQAYWQAPARQCSDPYANVDQVMLAYRCNRGFVSAAKG